MATPAQVLKDPNFLALPVEEQRKVLSAIDPNFGMLPKAEQDKVFKVSVPTTITEKIDTTKWGHPNYKSSLPWPISNLDEATSDTTNAMAEGASKLFGPDSTPDERFGGASQMGRGFMGSAGVPFLLQGAVSAPIKMAKGLAVSVPASMIGSGIADLSGAGPGVQDFTGDAAGLLGFGIGRELPPLPLSRMGQATGAGLWNGIWNGSPKEAFNAMRKSWASSALPLPPEAPEVPPYEPWRPNQNIARKYRTEQSSGQRGGGSGTVALRRTVTPAYGPNTPLSPKFLVPPPPTMPGEGLKVTPSPGLVKKYNMEKSSGQRGGGSQSRPPLIKRRLPQPPGEGGGESEGPIETPEGVILTPAMREAIAKGVMAERGGFTPTQVPPPPGGKFSIKPGEGTHLDMSHVKPGEVPAKADYQTGARKVWAAAIHRDLVRAGKTEADVAKMGLADLTLYAKDLGLNPASPEKLQLLLERFRGK